MRIALEGNHLADVLVTVADRGDRARHGAFADPRGGHRPPCCLRPRGCLTVMRDGSPDRSVRPALRGSDCSVAADGERACAPEVTLGRIRPYFGDLGITRVGLVTGLDRVGVPVGMAVRPNGLSLSVHQGKGLTEAAALVSAAMEAVEVALAERVSGGDVHGRTGGARKRRPNR